MDQQEFQTYDRAIKLAISHVLQHGSDDIFRNPVFSGPIERSIILENQDAFEKEAYHKTLNFLKRADLRQERIGPAHRCLIVRDQKSFRQVCWLDPFDTIKYLAVALTLFDKIENRRIDKCENIIHSHRISNHPNEVFDRDYGYGSFRSQTGKLARDNVGKWLVVTDISNFFDRIGNHSLNNHLLDIGCHRKMVALTCEILLHWSGDRRSFGLPVGSDGSRILSEAVFIDIDQQLKERNIPFARYVDDFRLIAKSQSEAYNQLLFLTELLAEEGLALNSGKTLIARIEENYDVGMPVKDADEGHEKIDTEQTVERKITVRVSGRTSYSKRFEKPGKEALRKLKKLTKSEVEEKFQQSNDANFESNVKLVVKFFVYVDQDIQLLLLLIRSRKTTIFYICDALIKESDRFDREMQERIRDFIYSVEDWESAAYPYAIPVIRLFAQTGFRDDRLARLVFDRHRLEENLVFFREFLMVAYPSLDRRRIRRLAIDMFGTVPAFLKRVVFLIVEKHEGLSEDERRPLLKNMKQSTDDWFLAKK